jgi:hypothetical protein
MQAATKETTIPMENKRNGGIMRVRRKFATLLEYFSNPFSTMPPPQDDALPAAKKPRLQSSTSSSKAADADAGTVVDAHLVSTLPTSPDVMVAVAPTNAVTVAARSPRAGASRAHAPPRSWRPEEDAKLTTAVGAHGISDWLNVAAMVPGRTNGQCRQRWVAYLDPTIEQTSLGNKGKWTRKEDAKLTKAVQKHSDNWVRVAAMVSGRTNGQCRYRWVNILESTTASARNKGKWSSEEDEKLTDAVTELGNNAWAAVAAMVPGRSYTQCRYRWVGISDPTIEHTMGKWTPEEDEKLAEAVTQLGKDWAKVTELVPGRTREQCRRRWVHYFDPTTNQTSARSGKWTPEEDAKLTEAVTELGNDWAAVAAMVPGRVNTQCRSRWGREFGRRHQNRKMDRTQNNCLTL